MPAMGEVVQVSFDSSARLASKIKKKERTTNLPAGFAVEELHRFVFGCGNNEVSTVIKGEGGEGSIGSVVLSKDLGRFERVLRDETLASDG